MQTDANNDGDYQPSLAELLVRKLRIAPQRLYCSTQRLFLTPYFNHLIINEYPRSGGSWISRLISDSSGISVVGQRGTSRKIIHEHRIGHGEDQQVYVIRDGRDLMISNYFHCFFVNDRNNAGRVARMRKHFAFDDYKDISRNLYRFIEVMLTKPVGLYFTLPEFIDDAVNSHEGIIVKYEEMKTAPVKTLGRILHFYNLNIDTARVESAIDKNDINRLKTNRIDRHIRKGIVGDWKNHFNRETAELYQELAGNQLQRLGYESDAQWVNETIRMEAG